MSIITTTNIQKVYNPESVPVHAINGINISFKAGEFTALVGASGCGKTTFLNILGGLEQPTEGEVIIDDTHLNTLSNAQLTDYRLANIGFVFQSYNLIPVLSAYENVAFIMQLRGFSKKDIDERVMSLLSTLGIEDKAKQRPGQLSGGQQQRVAVARALATRPKFILADEPTANLDSHSTETLLDLMLQMNQQEGTTFIFSTHDERVMKKARRLVRMEDGIVINDEEKA